LSDQSRDDEVIFKKEKVECMMIRKPIGMLDSGVGGLTVLKAVKERLPHESFVYIGDTLRNPYGNKEEKDIITYTLELADFLVSQGVKMIVIACNTATAQALKEVSQRVSVPVIGVIVPGSEAAAKLSQTKKVGVLATRSTVDSGFYEKTIKSFDSDISIESLACPQFVDLVEQNDYRSENAKKVVAETLEPFKTATMDTLILGCTHFPLLAPFIQEVMGEDVTLIDSGALTSQAIERVLEEEQTRAEAGGNPSVQLYTTGSKDAFKKIAKDWLETDQFTIETIALERLTDKHGRNEHSSHCDSK